MAYPTRFVVIICICCFITGCVFFSGKKDGTSGADVEVINWQEQQKNCIPEELANNNCPTFKFNGVTFKHESQLNDLIEQRLLALLKAHDPSLWDLQKNYLARANKGDHLQLKATVLEQTPVFIIIELTAKETHTTDIYSPTKITLINYDKNTKKDVTLADAVEPDKLLAFWSTAQVVYKQWLEFNQLLNNKTYQEDWPFIETQHLALLSNELILKYDANTLAPYAMGSPVLIIPYNKLEGIIKPQYMPR